MFRLIVFILAASLSCLSHAKGYSPVVTAQPGGYGIKFASNGTPLAVPASTLPSGAVGAVAPSPITLPGGIVYPAIATAAVAAGAMLGPWGIAIGVGIAAGAIGIQALDVALDAAKIRFRPNGGGLEAADPAVCTVAPCYGYSSYYGDGKVLSTAAAVCEQYRSANTTARSVYTFVGTSGSICTFNYHDNFGYDADQVINANILGRVQVAPSLPVYTSTTPEAAAQLMSARSPTQAEVQALVELGYGPILDLPTITGPASVFKGNTVELGLDGTVREIEERYVASFGPGSVTIGVEKKQTVTAPGKQSTTVTTNPDGSTFTAVTTSPRMTASLTTSAALEQPPATKIDEAGTPSPISDIDYSKRLDKFEADSSARLPKIGGVADKGFFDGWSSLFSSPALVACEPMPLPRNMGALDPCPVVGGVREVMAYLWAASALFLCIGMVRRVL